MRAEIIEIDWITENKVRSNFDSRCFNPRTKADVAKYRCVRITAWIIHLPVHFAKRCFVQQIFTRKKDILKIRKIDPRTRQWTVPLPLPIFDSKGRIRGNVCKRTVDLDGYVTNSWSPGIPSNGNRLHVTGSN